MPLVRTAATYALCAMLACAAGSQAADSDTRPFRIVHRGSITLPSNVSDRNGNAVEITGLSGITWLGHDRYAAIMDNSDTLILFSLSLARDGTPLEASDFEVVTLAERHDYEDIAACPEPLQQRIKARRMEKGFSDPGRCLLVCEEDTPAIRVISLIDGSLLGTIPIPRVLTTRVSQRGLESIDIDPDGLHLWTANEEALADDGPAASMNAGTVVRLVRVAIPEPDHHRGEEPLQLAYDVDPPHPFVRVFAGVTLSGVVGLAGLGGGRLLVLERSGSPGLPPFENRIYLVETLNARDVTAIDRDLAAQTEAHLPKTLLWKDQLGCNIEGLCFGPRLPGGIRSLIAVADNGAIGTPNQLIAFELKDTGEEMLLPVIVAAATVVASLLGLAIYRLAR